MNRIKVLVVDDSSTMRQLVTRALECDPGIEVVGAAKSALEARDLIKQLNPDVMTLDVEMPEMDGLSFLERVMRLRPMPVVMVSTLTAKGTETAISALALGAIDCVVKPSAENPHSFSELPAKVKIASKVRRRQPEPAEQAPRFNGNYQSGWQADRDRLLHGRCRSTDRGALQVPGKLPAHPDNPAHAAGVHPQPRIKAGPHLCACRA